jgi:hypothetical protein
MRKVFILLFVMIVSMLQLGIFSNIQVLSGKIDLIMLGVIAWILQKKTEKLDILIYILVSLLILFFITAEPILILIGFYALMGVMIYWIKHNIQQFPIVSMLVFTAIFTFTHLAIFGFYLQLLGANIEGILVFQTVILPSILFNLIAAIPMFLLINELQHLVYPMVEEI